VLLLVVAACWAVSPPPNAAPMIPMTSTTPTQNHHRFQMGLPGGGVGGVAGETFAMAPPRRRDQV